MDSNAKIDIKVGSSVIKVQLNLLARVWLEKIIHLVIIF